jgi:hypothetical protein
MDSLSSSAISITSMPRRSRNFPTIPKIRGSRRCSGPRGVLHCKATADPRFGPIGKQTIEDTGRLTKKRMETVDEEITAAALEGMEKQAKADQPFFLWYNSTAMHLRTHVAERNIEKSGQDLYSDRMVVHNEHIGMMLDKLDELGIATTQSSCTPRTTARRMTRGPTAPTLDSALRRIRTMRRMARALLHPRAR